MSQLFGAAPKEFVVQGKHVFIGPFTTLGFAGFGFEKNEDGTYKKPLKRKRHDFKVVIGNNVEIGCGCCINRGSWRDSIIDSGTKIDNMVHTGHNTQIGKNCLIAVGTTIGGSCTIGNDVFIGMNATILQGLTIANKVTIGMGAVVTKDILEEGTTWVGNPAHKLEKK